MIDLPERVRVSMWQDGSVLLLPYDEKDDRMVAGVVFEWDDEACLVMANGRVLAVHRDGRWTDRTEALCE